MLRIVTAVLVSAALAGCAAPYTPQQQMTRTSAATAAPAGSADRGFAFALKEFQIGAPMPSCPEGTSQQSYSGAMLICVLGSTTLANQAVESHGVWLFEGRIVGASYNMARRGQYANGEVLEALIAKYGEPPDRKRHINEARWWRNGQVLSFDGWKGTVSMLDQQASRKATAQGAQKNKSDL